MFRQLQSLFKLRIGFLMMLTAITAMAAAPGPPIRVSEAAILAVAVFLASAGASALNHYYETDIDAQMVRTRNRPFVTGGFHKGPLWLAVFVGLVFCGVASAAIALNSVAALFIFLGAFIYSVVYTVWLKRRTWMNIVIGGASGSCAVLAGAATVDPQFGPVPIQLALVLFFWTPSHFWSLACARQEDYAAAGVPMLPTIVGIRTAARAILANTAILVLISLLPFFYGLSWIYLLGATSGGAYFLYRCVQMVRDPSASTAMQGFFASLAQLQLLLIGILLDVLILRANTTAGDQSVTLAQGLV